MFFFSFNEQVRNNYHECFYKILILSQYKISGVTMPPNQTINVITTQECDDCTAQNEGIQKVDKGTESGQEIIWINAITIILFHIVALIALLYTSFKMKLLTALWSESCSRVSHLSTKK